MPFDLTVKQCNAGPGHSVYTFTKDGVILTVLDMSDCLGIVDGNGAVIISYQEINTLYVFQSGKFPPQEPKLLLNASGALSIEGAGLVVTLKTGSIKEAMAEAEIQFAEIHKALVG